MLERIFSSISAGAADSVPPIFDRRANYFARIGDEVRQHKDTPRGKRLLGLGSAGNIGALSDELRL